MLYSIFNAIVRSSPTARESVLKYLSHVLHLNVKRSGMQVDMSTVATDGFIVNLQSLLLAFRRTFS